MSTDTTTSVTQEGKSGGDATGTTVGGAGASGGVGYGGGGAVGVGVVAGAGALGVGVGGGGSADSSVTGAAAGDATDNTTIDTINIS